MTQNNLIETKDLSKTYVTKRNLFGQPRSTVQALDGINLTIRQQETLGVVGESGCGKTTFGRVLLRLIEATSGQILYKGEDILSLSKSEFQAYRQNMQMVFQNPYSTFDPRFSVAMSLSEPLKNHTDLRGDALQQRMLALLEQVGMPADALSRYPHEFSGGQLQRIAVARALALSPEFIVLDEPTSALDVSIQAQILNLLRELQSQLNLTYVFISHDLGVVEYISDRIAVMYLGRLVELLTPGMIFAGEARHPYTQALLAAVPEVYPGTEIKTAGMGKIQAQTRGSVGGCSFRARCPMASAVCGQQVPQIKDINEDHLVACHLMD
jgi:oligopeptide/dipeptide ABC transporter ATP-binding protein